MCMIHVHIMNVLELMPMVGLVPATWLYILVRSLAIIIIIEKKRLCSTSFVLSTSLEHLVEAAPVVSTVKRCSTVL